MMKNVDFGIKERPRYEPCGNEEFAVAFQKQLETCLKKSYASCDMCRLLRAHKETMLHSIGDTLRSHRYTVHRALTDAFIHR